MPGILCEHCTGACCRYVALPIDEPETQADFDDVRWFLMHAHVSVFVEEGAWYIAFETPCRQLQPDQRCGAYGTRPKVCRAYSADECDYHSGDYGWEHHFTSPEHLDEYARAHPPSATRRKARKNGQLRRRRVQALSAQLDRQGVPLPALPFQP